MKTWREPLAAALLAGACAAHAQAHAQAPAQAPAALQAPAQVQGTPAEILAAARAAVDRGATAQALELFERVRAARGDDADLLIEMARVAGFADRNADAARLYRRALDVAPERRADIEPSLAWQTFWSGNAAEAATVFERLAAEPRADADDPAPRARRVDALDGLGQARQELGQQASALVAFRAAHALQPDNARLHRRYAMSLLWNGHEQAAVHELERLVRAAPGDRDLAWALANARNFSGDHAAALAGFLAQTPPVAAGERADLARAWRWAGFEERAFALLVDPTDEQARWLREYRVRRDLVPFAYATLERSEDRDALVTRGVVLGAGWHPLPGSTVDLQGRHVALDDPFGAVRGEQLLATVRLRFGAPDGTFGTIWPTASLRVVHWPGWTAVLPSLRARWLPQDRWRVDAELTREGVETPRAVFNRVTVDVWSVGVEQRPWTSAMWGVSAAALRFDDGTARVRLGGRVEHTLLGRPRLVGGIEATAFERTADGGGDGRGYWNPRRYREARAYVRLTHEMRPFDIVARVGLGRSHEVDGAGNASSGTPHLWELGLGWDLSPSLRAGLAMGGTGAGMGVNGGGAGYWRRFVNLSINGWF